MGSSFKRALAFGLALTGLAFAAPAGAQQQQQQQQQVSPYVQQVIDQLGAIVPMMAQQGYGDYELLAASAINQGSTETTPYSSQDNGDVIFVAVCDNDCSDIDIRVRASGAVLGEDVLPDDVPVVQVQSNARPLSVDVIMATCSVEPCVYGLAVFRH